MDMSDYEAFVRALEKNVLASADALQREDTEAEAAPSASDRLMATLYGTLPAWHPGHVNWQN